MLVTEATQFTIYSGHKGYALIENYSDHKIYAGQRGLHMP